MIIVYLLIAVVGGLSGLVWLWQADYSATTKIVAGISLIAGLLLLGLML